MNIAKKIIYEIRLTKKIRKMFGQMADCMEEADVYEVAGRLGEAMNLLSDRKRQELIDVLSEVLSECLEKRP